MDRAKDMPDQAFSIEELDRHFQNMPDGFFLMKLLLDGDGKPYDWVYVYANKAALANSGIPREEFIGRSFFEIFGETGDAKWLEPYYEAAYKGVSQVFDDYSPEVHRFVQVTCFQYEYGYAACFVRDVTQKQLYEKTLQSTALSYRAVFFVDLRSDYYQCVYPTENGSMEQGSYAQAIDRHFAEGVIIREDETNVRRFLSAENAGRELRDRDHIEYKYRRRAPDGGREWCLVSFNVGERLDGVPITAILSVRSIDELVQAEQAQQEALQKAVREAERANRAKSDFLSSMSHDMRTPLNIVIGMATLARLHQDDPAQVLDCMDKIETSGKHLLTLINQVLDMAKIESGEMTLSEGAFTMPELMEQVTQMAHGMIADRQQILTFRMRDFRHEKVIGDENRLVQVLLNLLSNACKYSDPGKHITVELEELPCDAAGYGRYRFGVTDEGRGMSQAFLNRLFEPFTREEDSRLSKTQGTGLGMAITRQIVERMGGAITVASQEGKGSCFTVEIPLKLQPEEPEPVSFPDERVLVVDDYADCITSICSVLDTMDVRHVCTQSGELALAAAEEGERAGEPFTCALLDYKMPGMDGLTLARELKQRCGNIQVGLVSAYDYAPIQRMAGEAAVDFFCPKPVFRSVLLETFRTLHSRGQEKAQPSPAASASAESAALRALIAEDNSINATIEAKLLEHFGVQSVVAENGAEAVEKLRASAPGTFDCVFMDVQMPVMDGLSAARAIRGLDHPDAGLPIFAMTANVFTDDIERTKAAGMQEHIAKPIELEQLRMILRKWFPRQMCGI